MPVVGVYRRYCLLSGFGFTSNPSKFHPLAQNCFNQTTFHHFNIVTEFITKQYTTYYLPYRDAWLKHNSTSIDTGVQILFYQILHLPKIRLEIKAICLIVMRNTVEPLHSEHALERTHLYSGHRVEEPNCNFLLKFTFFIVNNSL